MENMYEVIIIGGGPAGAGAGVYSARKKMKTLLIAESFGGQSIVSSDIGNWIGDVVVSGIDLAKRFEEHLRTQEDLEIASGERVELITEIESGENPVFEVKTNKNTYKTYSVIIGTGGRRRKLKVKGEKDFDGKGVAYCSTCDAPMFKGRDVIVVGTGNSALEGVLDLNSYANKIYLFSRREELRGDPLTQEHVKELDKVEIMWNVEITEIVGETMITGVKYKNTKTGEDLEMPIGGVFIEIGSEANSEMVKDLVDLNEQKEIIVDHKLYSTSCPGIFAAGDVTDVVYKQNNISVGNAVSATLTCYDYIQKLRQRLGNHKS